MLISDEQQEKQEQIVSEWSQDWTLILDKNWFDQLFRHYRPFLETNMFWPKIVLSAELFYLCKSCFFRSNVYFFIVKIYVQNSSCIFGLVSMLWNITLKQRWAASELPSCLRHRSSHGRRRIPAKTGHRDFHDWHTFSTASAIFLQSDNSAML